MTDRVRTNTDYQVENLRELARLAAKTMNEPVEYTQEWKAADTIESLQAEVERLKKGGPSLREGFVMDKPHVLCKHGNELDECVYCASEPDR